MRLLNLYLLAALSTFFLACSDDDSSIEYLFEREATEISVLRECASDADSGAACYQVRFHYPMAKSHFKGVYLWVGDKVVDDTSKAVNDDQIDKADGFYEYSSKKEALYDTIDLTKLIVDYLELYDSLHVALFCDYDDGDDVVGTNYCQYAAYTEPEDYTHYLLASWNAIDETKGCGII